ncbi:hypothetical protein GH714_042482 [Hevea brasiliensis]|uniref:Alkyl transferase n=1 Tax=Hevea brasiliensis TaxID=3981 RepID=A0A6A6K0K2_HEVBR|nr:hypothetical protein GH714_042482 [Hevea brasiliensis]
MFLSDISGIRTGRVSASLLDGVFLTYYGNKVRLNTVASISVSGRTLLISLWDASILGDVKAAIDASNLGFSMTCEATTIRLVVPELTNDVRKSLVKMLSKLTEEGRVSVRNIRRDTIDKLKSMQDNKEISEDDFHSVSAEIQKVTDTFIKKIDGRKVGAYQRWKRTLRVYWPLKRSTDEVSDIMSLFSNYLSSPELRKLAHDYGASIRFVGDLKLLRVDLVEHMFDIQSVTRNNDALCLNVAVSYGARQDIIQAVNAALDSGVEFVDGETLSSFMWTKDLPDVDLLIRSGGEKRISNFLLWQLAYAELYFCDIMWPDFTAAHFSDALDSYLARHRKYGR